MVAIMTRKIYSAVVTKKEGLWQIDLGEIGTTATKYDHEIDLMTREYVAQKTNVQPFDFDLTYDFTTPGPNSFEPNKFEKLALKIRRVLNF